jgi:hypothetical protein
MAVDTPTQGWVILAPLHQPTSVFPEENISPIAKNLIVIGLPFWQWNSQAGQNDPTFTWSLGGTLPDWQGVPLAIVVLLEKPDLRQAAIINETLLKEATNP